MITRLAIFFFVVSINNWGIFSCCKNLDAQTICTILQRRYFFCMKELKSINEMRYHEREVRNKGNEGNEVE